MRPARRKLVRRKVARASDPRHLLLYGLQVQPAPVAACERQRAGTLPMLSMRQPVFVKQWFREAMSSVTKMDAQIDPRAVISPSARLGAGVRVGAYAIVGDDVELGSGCVLHPHAIVQGPARLGCDNVLHAFCSIAGDPQDLKFAGERTMLETGDRNIFRECVTISRGTAQGGGITRIGSDNLFLACAHVGHDCVVGSHTLFVNSATLAGHVIVEDFATVGAFSPVHQFCRIGRYAYIGASTVITQDVPPFSRVVTERTTQCFGVNAIGLERHGFPGERIRTLESAYRLLLRSKLNTTQAIEQMRATLNGSADVAELIAFIESAERGVTK